MKKVNIFSELVRLSLFTVGIAAFTACSEEQILLTQDRQDGLLKINTSITQSRDVVTGTSFAEGDKIGIFVTLDGGHDYTGNSSNVDATWQKGNWTLSRDVALLENYPAYVYAYYPYDKNTVRTNDTIRIDITPDVVTGQPDYMYGSDPEVTVENPTADILFRHVLARVTLAVTKSATDVGDGIISQARLENDTLYEVLNTTAGRLMKKIGKGNHISTQGKMSLADGGIRSTLNEDAYIQIPVNKTISTDEVQYIDFLVQPCGSEIQIRPTNRKGGNACVILNIDGNPYKISLGYPFWEAGKQYTYPVTIDRKTVPEPTISVGEPIYLGFDGDNGKPLYWSSWNLGASSPEDYGGLYGWGDSTGKKISIDLIDYPSADPPTDISGTEYDIVRVMWGANWRMPTNDELSNLDKNCTVKWTTQDGVKGCLFTSNINGNSIFLPYSPERTGTEVDWSEWNTVSGTFQQSRLYCRSKMNTSDNQSASCLYFDNDSNCWMAKGAKRYKGLPIRPVTEQP